LQGEIPQPEEMNEPHIIHRSLSHRPDFGNSTQRSFFTNSSHKNAMNEIPEAAEENNVNYSGRSNFSSNSDPDDEVGKMKELSDFENDMQSDDSL